MFPQSQWRKNGHVIFATLLEQTRLYINATLLEKTRLYINATLQFKTNSIKIIAKELQFQKVTNLMENNIINFDSTCCRK